MPTESSFTGGGSRADDIKSWTKKLLVVNIFKTGEAIGIIFKRVNVSFKVVGEIVRNVRRFRRKSGVVPAGKVILSVSDDFSKRFFTVLSFVDEHVTKFDKFAQIGFFLDDIGVIFGASSGKGSVDKREQIAMFNLAKVARFAQRQGNQLEVF